MGKVVECYCLDCGASSDVAVGGTMRMETLWCDSCPNFTSRPRSGADGPLPCSCGGQFTSAATPRCQECHSARVEYGRTKLYFD